jgi:hypothetical protein
MRQSSALIAISMTSVLWICCGSAAAAPPLRVEVLSPDVEKYGLIELAIEAPRRYTNPFNSQEVELSLVIKTPSGQTLRLPAFFAQQFEQKILPKSGRAAAWMYPTGQPVWRARFAPVEVGVYRVVAELSDSDGLASSEAVEFRSTASRRAGFVRVSRRDSRFFEFDNGQPFFPIGQNLAFIGENRPSRNWQPTAPIGCGSGPAVTIGRSLSKLGRALGDGLGTGDHPLCRCLGRRPPNGNACGLPRGSTLTLPFRHPIPWPCDPIRNTP